jgi:release factor glutamine methyltransferase
VRVFDPPGALLAGADGLACYRPLVAQAGQTLTSDGLLVLETSDFRAPRVAEILEGHGFSAIEPHRDLAGQVRCLTARGRRKF